jgi:hypothetical protein
MLRTLRHMPARESGTEPLLLVADKAKCAPICCAARQDMWLLNVPVMPRRAGVQEALRPNALWHARTRAGCSMRDTSCWCSRPMPRWPRAATCRARLSQVRGLQRVVRLESAFRTSGDTLALLF